MAITPDVLVGAVVDEVVFSGEMIDCVKLTLPDGRSVDLNACGDTEEYGDPWMEVL